ncbi:MAG: hypothetical protein V9E94_19255 [Microthrixaceae bacterium]
MSSVAAVHAGDSIAASDLVGGALEPLAVATLCTPARHSAACTSWSVNASPSSVIADSANSTVVGDSGGHLHGGELLADPLVQRRRSV